MTRSDDLGAFWHILTERLSAAHGAAPTHSLQEIERLRGHFPDNIRLYTASAAGLLRSGMLVFDCGQVVYVQYMADRGRGTARSPDRVASALGQGLV